MRPYEAMFLMKPDLNEEAYGNFVDKYTNLIQNNGGEIVNVDRIGKRKLAYEINRLREAYYTLVNFNAEPAAAQELERIMKISDEVFRFLVIRKDEK